MSYNPDNNNEITEAEDIVEDDTNHGLLYRTSTRFLKGSLTDLDEDLKTLQNTVDSALGTPEIGAVNFNHLHHVLTSIIKNLCKIEKESSIKASVHHELQKSTSELQRPSLHQQEICDQQMPSQSPSSAISQPSPIPSPIVKPSKTVVAEPVNENINQLKETVVTFIDKTNNSLNEIRKDIEELHQKESSATIVEKPIGIAEESLKKLKHLNKRVNEVEDVICNCATKDEIQNFISAKEVKDLLNNNMESLQNEVRNNNSKCSDDLVQLNFRLQREIDEINSKIEGSVEQNKKLQLELSKKAESSALESKCDKIEIENIKTTTNKDIKDLQDKISRLEENRKQDRVQIEELKSKSEVFTDRIKILGSTGKKIENKLEEVMDALHQLQTGHLKNQQPNTVDEAVITKIRNNINDLHDQQCKFQDEIDKQTMELKNNDLTLNGIKNELKNLQENKVDEFFVISQLSNKADKDNLIHMVTMDRLDNYSNELDHRITNLGQQIIGNEAQKNKAIKDVLEKLNDKMNKDKLKEIRGYIDECFRNFKPKLPPMEQENIKATATRKPLLQQSNCISCDQVVIPKEVENSPLPCYHALPIMKSMRPAATFELQHIRQHMNQSWNNSNRDRYEASRTRDKLQKEVFSMHDVDCFEELTNKSTRYCGGEHTSIVPEQRSSGSPPMFYRQENTSSQHMDQQKLETDVMGIDGHVYKGRLSGEGSSSSVNKKEFTTRFTPSPPRVRSPKLSPTFRRTKTPSDSGRSSPISLP